MELQTPDEHIDAVGVEEVRRWVQRLAAGEVEFLILQATPMTYLQATGDARSGFAVEYQDGSPEQHYQATDGTITEEQLEKAFVAYCGGAPEWKSQFTWERELGGGCLGLLLLLAAGPALAAVRVWLG
jgi:hypothetical protein